MEKSTKIPILGIIAMMFGLVLLSVAQDMIDADKKCMSLALSNTTNPFDIWMEKRDGKTYCCGNTGEKSYERDEGTLMYFLAGKKAYYNSKICKVLE